MKRQQKELVIGQIKDALQESQASFLVNYKGLDVAQVSALRGKLREQNGSFKVSKVTLIRRAMNEIPSAEEMKPYLKEQIALVFAQNESPAIAKILDEFSRENKDLSILAGFMDDKVLSTDSVKILANLPSREILLAQVACTMKAPITGIAAVLNMLIIRLLFVLKEIEKKKA